MRLDPKEEGSVVVINNFGVYFLRKPMTVKGWATLSLRSLILFFSTVAIRAVDGPPQTRSPAESTVVSKCK